MEGTSSRLCCSLTVNVKLIIKFCRYLNIISPTSFANMVPCEILACSAPSHQPENQISTSELSTSCGDAFEKLLGVARKLP